MYSFYIAFVSPAHPQGGRYQVLQEEGAEEAAGGICFSDAEQEGYQGGGGGGE